MALHALARGVYPADLPQRRELEYASRQFDSIELNGSFYSLQRPANYQRWHDDTPATFLFSVKGSRFITHMKRLKEIDAPLANFFASGVLCLRAKLGPMLWQFPPQFRYHAEKFEHFFSLLPRSSKAAGRLAKKHDEKLTRGRVWARSDQDRPIRHAVEIRHESFLCDEFFAQLRRHKIAFVFADTAGKWPYVEDVTAEFIYIRLHGDEELYVSGYSDRALDWWAARIQKWRAGSQPSDAKVFTSIKPARRSRDVYVYFDNDAKVKAPYDAQQLIARLP